MIKLGFFGTTKISAYVLKELSKIFEVKWVVTQKDRPTGRGLKIQNTEVKTVAKELGIKVFQYEKFDKAASVEVVGERVDIAFVVAYGCYIPSCFIKSFDKEPLNIHLSKLPKYRGAAPVARSIMNGDSVTGFSIMKIAKEMDAGDVVFQRDLPIEVDDDTETLTWKLIKIGTSAIIELLPKYLAGKLSSTSQDS